MAKIKGRQLKRLTARLQAAQAVSAAGKKKALVKAVGKQRGRMDPAIDSRITDSRGVFEPTAVRYGSEGEIGMPSHFGHDDPDISYDDKELFSNAHHKLLENDDGTPMFDQMGMEMIQPGQQATVPGYWQDPRYKDPRINPMHEYTAKRSTLGRQKAMGEYIRAVTAQDGVPITDLLPGTAPGGMGKTVIRRPTDAGGLASTVEEFGRTPIGSRKFGPTRPLKFDDDFYGGASADGDMIGSFGEVNTPTALRWKQALGKGAEVYHKRDPTGDYLGAPAGKSGKWGEYDSMAESFESARDAFKDIDQLEDFDRMMRQTAKQAGPAYEEMQDVLNTNGIKTGPDGNFTRYFEEVRKNPKKSPSDILDDLKSRGIISMNDVNDIVLRFYPEEGNYESSGGLLA